MPATSPAVTSEDDSRRAVFTRPGQSVTTEIWPSLLAASSSSNGQGCASGLPDGGGGDPAAAVGPEGAVAVGGEPEGHGDGLAEEPGGEGEGEGAGGVPGGAREAEHDGFFDVREGGLIRVRGVEGAEGRWRGSGEAGRESGEGPGEGPGGRRQAGPGTHGPGHGTLPGVDSSPPRD